jgi:hypothetical protein
MSRKHPETTEDRYELAPAPTEAGPTPLTIPEGMDEAIYRQGWMEARRDAQIGTASLNPYVNPFQPDTPQAAAWRAGYDVGIAPV